MGLSQDPEFRATTFVVIDFETTTPSGARPEPIDVAALWLHARDGVPVRTGRRFQALIRPPAHAPVSASDTYQTGITPVMVASQPAASQIPVPAGRHRAMPDVEVTATLFTRILADGITRNAWRTVADLRRLGGFRPRATRPIQDVLLTYKADGRPDPDLQVTDDAP